MKEAEAAIRARYKTEIDAVNDRFDEKERITRERHEKEIEDAEDHFGKLLTDEKAYWDKEKEDAEKHYAEKRRKVNEFYDNAEADWRKHFDEQRAIAKWGHDGSLAAWEKYYDDLAEKARIKYEQAEENARGHAGRMAEIVPSGGGGGGGNDGTGGGAGPELGGEGGGRAMGGPVAAGVGYIVGERGPELFTPRVGGSVTSNTDLRRLISAVEQSVNRPIRVYLDDREITIRTMSNLPHESYLDGSRRD